MAERVGFEPTCRLPDKTLSRRPRYDHFGTSPNPLSSRRALHVSLMLYRTMDVSSLLCRPPLLKENLYQLPSLNLQHTADYLHAVIECRMLERPHY